MATRRTVLREEVRVNVPGDWIPALSDCARLMRNSVTEFMRLVIVDAIESEREAEGIGAPVEGSMSKAFSLPPRDKCRLEGMAARCGLSVSSYVRGVLYGSIQGLYGMEPGVSKPKDTSSNRSRRPKPSDVAEIATRDMTRLGYGIQPDGSISIPESAVARACLTQAEYAGYRPFQRRWWHAHKGAGERDGIDLHPSSRHHAPEHGLGLLL